MMVESPKKKLKRYESFISNNAVFISGILVNEMMPIAGGDQT